MDDKATSDEQKQMLKYLQKRAQDHMKEKICLVEMNEELEKVIIDKDKEILEIKKELKAKDERVKVFEEEYEIGYDETIAIRDRAETLKAETLEYKKRLKEVEATLRKMDKKKEISDKLIKFLQVENSDLKEKLETGTKIKEQLNAKIKDDQDNINHLLEDISEIKTVNKEKGILLERVSNENEIIKEKLAELEKETADLKVKLEAKEIEKDEIKSLSEELGIVDPRSQNVSVECDPCDKDFERTVDLKKHKHSAVKKIFEWKLKEMELERKLNSQKLKITSDLFEVKKKEVSVDKTCNCRRFCRINHFRYNFKKSFSQETTDKFKSIHSEYSCYPCDKTNENVDGLNHHLNSVHTEEESEEGVKMGEYYM